MEKKIGLIVIGLLAVLGGMALVMGGRSQASGEKRATLTSLLSGSSLSEDQARSVVQELIDDCKTGRHDKAIKLFSVSVVFNQSVHQYIPRHAEAYKNSNIDKATRISSDTVEVKLNTEEVLDTWSNVDLLAIVVTVGQTADGPRISHMETRKFGERKNPQAVFPTPNR